MTYPSPYIVHLFISIVLLYILQLLILDSIVLLLLLSLILWYSLRDSNPGYLDTKIYDADIENHQLLEASQNASRNYCERCKKSQPLRVYHCKKCNACVHCFDHHCAFIRTCIGERNHGRFVIFISLHLVMLWTYTLRLYHSHIEEGDSYYSLLIYFTSLIAVVYFSILTIFISALFGFHAFLVATNSSGYEVLKGINVPNVDACDFPFRRGPMDDMMYCIVKDEFWSRLHNREWTPSVWSQPVPFQREGTSVFDNPWNNQYYSCC